MSIMPVRAGTDDGTLVPMPVTPLTFARLAQSSPWRWRSLQLRYADSRYAVRAWVGRPRALRVETLDGRLVQAVARPEHSAGSMISFGVDGVSAPVVRPWPWEVEVPLDAEGLVVRRPSSFEVELDDEIFQTYRFVAALDPAELASGVDLTDVREQVWRDRLVWEATARPTPAYRPRCTCCALLPGVIAEGLFLAEGGGADEPSDPDVRFPDWRAEEFFVRLDVRTGVVAAVDRLDRHDPAARLTLDVEAVDGDWPPEHFVEPRGHRHPPASAFSSGAG